MGFWGKIIMAATNVVAKAMDKIDPTPVPKPLQSPDGTDFPDWFNVALHELGTAEISGPNHNPRILEYHSATSLRASSDEVPWCSSFVNWCFMKAGIKGTGSAAARSWLKWGQALKTPRPGCVVVLSRGSNRTSGHVAFLKAVSAGGQYVYLLGGNQSDQVSVSKFSAKNVLGYRWPS